MAACAYGGKRVTQRSCSILSLRVAFTISLYKYLNLRSLNGSSFNTHWERRWFFSNFSPLTSLKVHLLGLCWILLWIWKLQPKSRVSKSRRLYYLQPSWVVESVAGYFVVQLVPHHSCFSYTYCIDLLYRSSRAVIAKTFNHIGALYKPTSNKS